MSSASAHDVAEDVRDVDHRLAGLRSRSISANSRSVSRAVSEVVGSSKMMIAASSCSALATSTSWRSPGDSRSTGVSGARSRSTCASSCARRARRWLRGRSSASGPKRRRGKPSMKMFSAIVRLLKRLSSWWMKAMPCARSPRPGSAARRARRRGASRRRPAGRRRRRCSSACSCRRRSGRSGRGRGRGRARG